MTRAEFRAAAFAAMRENNVLAPASGPGAVPLIRGRDAACERAASEPLVARARVVFLEAGAALQRLRAALLLRGAVIVSPSARFLEDASLLVLDASVLPERDRAHAGGDAFHVLATPCPAEAAPAIDVLATGALVVDLAGGRMGAGDGVFDLAYGLLRQLGRVSVRSPVLAVVAAAQILRGGVPMAAHDVPADLLVTETQSIRTHSAHARPPGLFADIAPAALRALAAFPSGGGADGPRMQRGS